MEETIRVLHADDESSFVEMAATFLEREDDRFVVETVASASEGVERLDETIFDCVVSDYEMPGRNGIEFLRVVREKYPELPFILYTGKGSETVASEAISAGVTEYLQKQSGTEQYELLAHRINNAVDQYNTARRAETLDRIRTLVADISGALVRASTQREIETSVCEIISNAEPYRFAWIGHVDPKTDRIKPSTSVGVQEGYLEEITVTADESPTGQGPAGRAIRNRKITVSQNVKEDPGFEPWRKQALDRGFQSVGSVPLLYNDTVFGVLVVYADRINAFDETEQELLVELGNNISRTMHSIQTRLEQEQTNALLSTLLDLLPVGVIAENADRNIIVVNQRLLELFDISAEPATIIGRDCKTVAEELSSLFENPEEYTQRIEALIDARESVKGEELQLRDGRTFERSYQPIELPEGDGNLWVYRNTTERTQRQKELERRTEQLEDLTNRLKAQYRYLFEQAPVMAIITRDQDGEPIIEDCDRLFAEKIGLDNDDIIGRPLADFYSEESKETLLNGGYDRALQGEFTRENRTLETVDGDVIETTLRAIPRPDMLDGADGTLGLFIDITEQERLKREKTRLKEFTDIVSHDLRSPLSVVEGRLDLARRECDSDHLDDIERAHDRMETLIENLLTLARSGQHPNSMESIELSAAAERHWQGVETGDVTMITDTELEFEADRSQLGQLLENLFRNATEHGFAEPSATHDEIAKTVTVGTLPSSDGFYVEDNGFGIDSDDHEKLFESGYSTAESGIGIGLAIVKRIATAHGWTVDAIESDAGGVRVEIGDVCTTESC